MSVLSSEYREACFGLRKFVEKLTTGSSVSLWHLCDDFRTKHNDVNDHFDVSEYNYDGCEIPDSLTQFCTNTRAYLPWNEFHFPRGSSDWNPNPRTVLLVYVRSGA